MPDDQPAILWTLLREQHVIACQVRLAAYGIDVTIVRDGSAVITRTFETDTEALAWAAQKRAEREADGWRPLLPAATKAARTREPLS